MSELTKALCAFHKSVGTINKTAKSYTNEYAPLSEVLSVVTPALSAQGLCITQTFEPGLAGEPPNIITTLHHVSGETVESRLPLIIAKGKNPLHDLGSAITYCRRYSLLAVISQVADVDTDGNLEEPASVPSAGTSKPAPKAAAKPAPQDPDLTAEQREEVTMAIKAIENKDYVVKFCKAFAARFKVTGKVSDNITKQSHYDFVQEYLSANAP